ncbi:hypothetical protein [Haloarcula pellucida]|uniref:Lipoprotein n=1 Tax=Haloarcula pellucida TaxID=1427151 RepID=A0A830GQM8_9EURY|nr:hypothetical protein [Halomicroarcula pellucida]MBX0350338.1 hypothetical protein [Halomicroarcula pellucida]GGO01583.1 hypothetical protein GCM10009030_35410 [Halomicroarcula pellucida]
MRRRSRIVVLAVIVSPLFVWFGGCVVVPIPPDLDTALGISPFFAVGIYTDDLSSTPEVSEG